jgi:twinkle protein
MGAAAVAWALAERIEVLVRELLPNGAKKGHEWRVGNVPGDQGSSLAVHLSGLKAGVWCDFADRRKRRCT